MAFTWIEALVCLAIIGILAALALPAVTGSSGGHGGFTQTLSNMRQLHLATQQMALDGQTTTNPALGWPGDTDGTFSNWEIQLVPGYLTTNDFRKLLSAPGKIIDLDALPLTMRETAILVYAAREDSPGDAVFLTSGNFTNTPNGGMPLEKSAKPYGEKGFVVFRKGGDGVILLKRQVGQTNVIGSFVPLLK